MLRDAAGKELRQIGLGNSMGHAGGLQFSLPSLRIKVIKDKTERAEQAEQAKMQKHQQVTLVGGRKIPTSLYSAGSRT